MKLKPRRTILEHPVYRRVYRRQAPRPASPTCSSSILCQKQEDRLDNWIDNDRSIYKGQGGAICHSPASPIHLLPHLPRYEPGSTHRHRDLKQPHLEHVGVDQEGRRQNRIAPSCSGLGTPNATARSLLLPTRPPSLKIIRTSHSEVSTSTLFAITLSKGSAVFLRKPSCQASLGNHRRLQIQVKSGQTTLKLVPADSLVIAGSQTPLHRFLQPSGRWVYDGHNSSPRENTIRKGTGESSVLDSDVAWSLRCPEVGFKGEHPSDHIVATKYVSTASDLERVEGIL
ncbi:Myo-inositol-1-phosphate synthase [Marasmius sp. AFHP31]|nr:Myo-inositol-1-phosphate synthase [Marasmius sp. AFHP31]